MLCPELKELRTPIKGLSNLDARLTRQLRRQCAPIAPQQFPEALREIIW